MAGIKIVDLPPLGRDLASTDLLELSLAGGTGSRKITGQEIMNASKLSINNTPIINGTVGRVLFQGTGDVLQQSSSLFWDNTNGRLGIGTSSPTTIVDIQPPIGGPVLRVARTSGAAVQISASILSTGGFVGTYTASPFILVSNSAEAMRLFTTGNIGINTTTDAGFRLDVNGTARVQDNLLLTNGIIATSAGLTRLQGSLNYFTHNRIGSSGTYGFQIAYVGSVYSFWRFNDGNLDVDFGGSGNLKLFANTERMRLFSSTGNVGINTTTDDGYKLDVNGTARVNSNSFFATSAGAADGGNGVGIGTTTLGTLDPNQRIVLLSSGLFPSYRLSASGGNTRGFIGLNGNNNALNIGTDTSTYFAFFSANAERMRIFTTGNVGINTTTDAGFRLDVNGTARIVNDAAIHTRLQNSAGTRTVTFNATSNMDMTLSHGSIYLTGSTVYGFLQVGATKISSTLIEGFNTFQINTDGGNTYMTSRQNTASPIKFFTGSSGTGTANKGTLLITDYANFAITPEVSAQLQVESTVKGFLPPRMTQAQRNAIASPAIGLEIYQTDATEGKYIYKSSGWTYIG